MSLTEKIRKYCTRLVASAVLAAAVAMPASCGSAILEKPPEQVSMREYTNFVKGAFDKKYDNHNLFNKDSLDELLETTHKIYGHLTVETTRFSYDDGTVKKESFERTMTGVGSGVVIDNDGKSLKILTANHVVKLPELENTYDAQKRPLVQQKIKETHYILEQVDMPIPLIALPFVGITRLSVGPELRVIARDKEYDLAVLQTKTSGDWLKHYKAVKTWGNSAELEPGDFLYAVGFPRNTTKQIMSGYVSAKNNQFTAEDDFIFYADASINPGNSGGPVYALRDGKPELVGIVRSKWPEGIGGIVRVNYAKRLLNRAGLGRLVR